MLDEREPRTRSSYLRKPWRSARKDAAKSWLPVARNARDEQLAVLTDPTITAAATSDADSLAVIERAIETSSYIPELPENWDDEGARPIAQRTWERAVAFLRASVLELTTRWRVVIESPRILPGPHGTVDIHWQNRAFMMLINITVDGPSDFYGETATGLSIKGTFIPEIHHQGILSWLKEHSRPT